MLTWPETTYNIRAIAPHKIQGSASTVKLLGIGPLKTRKFYLDLKINCYPFRLPTCLGFYILESTYTTLLVLRPILCSHIQILHILLGGSLQASLTDSTKFKKPPTLTSFLLAAPFR